MVVILLPGMDGTGELLAELVQRLGAQFQPVVVRYPPDKPLSYRELESLVRSRLPADRPYVITAESFSGPIAVSIAASAPPGLLGIVLSCSFVKNPRPLLRAFRSMVRFVPISSVPLSVAVRVVLGRFGSRPLREELARVLQIVTPAVLRGRLRAVLDVDVANSLCELRMPVLYLRATEDRLVPASASALITGSLSSANVVDVTGPHFLFQAVPGEAARHIKRFVKGLLIGAQPCVAADSHQRPSSAGSCG